MVRLGPLEDFVYEIGPNADLIGTAVPPHAAPPTPRAELAGLESLRRPAGPGTLPAYVSGQVSHVAPRESVALGLDGRVVAVSQVVREQGESRFAFVIEPRFLRGPANRIELFAVRARSLISLARFGSARDAYRRVGGRDFIVAGGRRIPVRERGLNGFVDGVQAAGAFLRIHGWSADTDRLRPAQQILVVSADRMASTGLTGVRRDDLADYYGESLKYAGYELDVPRRALAGCQARVIAVLGSRATELNWNPTARAGLRALACPPDR